MEDNYVLALYYIYSKIKGLTGGQSRPPLQRIFKSANMLECVGAKRSSHAHNSFPNHSFYLLKERNIRKVHIKVDLKIFLFLLLFLITTQLEMYILLMIFAILHELGHLVAGLILKFKPQEISIIPVGLQIKFEVKCEEYNKKILKGTSIALKRGIIAIAGPLTNFIIVCVIALLVKLEPSLANIEFYGINYLTLIYANTLIGFFNLLPIYPLDGGRIVKEMLHIFLGLTKAYKYTRIISKVTLIVLTVIASILILYLHNIAIPIIVVYLWLLHRRNK